MKIIMENIGVEKGVFFLLIKGELINRVEVNLDLEVVVV